MDHGTAREALVIGAGVSGLTTAICLAEAGWSVRIRTKDLPHDTTSEVAGALWGPSFQEPMAKTMAWTNASLADFTALAGEPGSGVRMAPALTVSTMPAGDPPPQARSIPELRACDPAELPPGFTSGFRAVMPLADMPRYLDHLTARLAEAGVPIEQRPVASLAEAAREAPLIVNCAGLGARDFGDDSVRPVFGQHVVVANPGLDLLFMELSTADEWTSYFPHSDRVVCGGVRVPGRWDRTPDPAITDRVLARVRALEPRLRDAEVIDVVTGLRPDRPSVRVETERIGTAQCIHNYGHSGTGVSLSWGCAHEATKLAG
ncbi:MAG: FAD-dependent oxidoreductase [Actinophytocola sp.]|uniref:FAD-dependent oxidoreductase n=1 Tax=Actinophytocola sp. TaxID=1872138 RepID=UPI003C78207D